MILCKILFYFIAGQFIAHYPYDFTRLNYLIMILILKVN
ncbi:hypothetical protein VIBNISFn27_60017 [Vibrio nigripulchritudo SFn27]|nr:hypothetical protein VIBNIAM115_1930025 [Vibrio nigripulchritudo AM115]CCN44673.1 hypothetical protein VIBNIFTn2_880002 [Vibrio nigripulchritudo FTn2]CCN62811.1 hypothetical protein VIBNIPon4_1000002 [Vibrio nigripulchritudo POn4]CCN74943.1 hypothetical protein VIBNISO65_1200002 [Vibrio nigripulchritudo SO65]CCN84061.1 hypothetical protein VIBNIBLFn1_670193 [Vibrio nigripulchritudo BLFn1]CCN89269.1 hypothetical protein VIBNISFn27_60017 [Vibrio nigripulchritudo SFn27]CCN93076.1 hypothetical